MGEQEAQAFGEPTIEPHTTPMPSGPEAFNPRFIIRMRIRTKRRACASDAGHILGSAIVEL